MKRKDFLGKLLEKGKIELVEPSEELKEAYLKKSRSNFESARILSLNDMYEESVSLAYYSMYNMLQALFLRAGFKSENHAASIILLKRIFDIDNEKISFAKKERIDKQYYVDSSITQKEVDELLKIAEDFNSSIYDFISRLDNEQISSYREKFEKLVRAGS